MKAVPIKSAVVLLMEIIWIIWANHFVTSWSFWSKKHSKRIKLRPSLLTSC